MAELAQEIAANFDRSGVLMFVEQASSEVAYLGNPYAACLEKCNSQRARFDGLLNSGCAAKDEISEVLRELQMTLRNLMSRPDIQAKLSVSAMRTFTISNILKLSLIHI